jgi:hypothetical protein
MLTTENLRAYVLRVLDRSLDRLPSPAASRVVVSLPASAPGAATARVCWPGFTIPAVMIPATTIPAVTIDGRR